jgi:hypothetical protein
MGILLLIGGRYLSAVASPGQPKLKLLPIFLIMQRIVAMAKILSA